MNGEPLGRFFSEKVSVSFRCSGRRVCFGRGPDVSSIFWTSVVQVEQMNKKVDFTCLKRLRTLRVVLQKRRLKPIQSSV